MTWADWIPALSSSAVVAIFGGLLLAAFKISIEKTIQHALDWRLEELKTKLRKDEAEFRAALTARDEQIAALRSMSLGGLASRHAALDRRRLEAGERLWACVVDQQKFKFVAMISTAFDMNKLIEMAAGGDDNALTVKEFARSIVDMTGITDVKDLGGNADRERLFLPQSAWLCFNAHRQIIAATIAQFIAVQTGSGSSPVKNISTTADIVKSLLPHRVEYIDLYGQSGLVNLLDEIEELIFQNLTSNLDGGDMDERNLQGAERMMRRVQTLSETMASSGSIPEPVELNVARQQIPPPIEMPSK